MCWSLMHIIVLMYNLSLGYQYKKIAGSTHDNCFSALAKMTNFNGSFLAKPLLLHNVPYLKILNYHEKRKKSVKNGNATTGEIHM